MLSFWFGWVIRICGFFWKCVVMIVVGMFCLIVEKVCSMLLFMRKLILLVGNRMWLLVCGLLGLILILML